MTDAPGLERLLKRDRLITIAGLATLCALAWLYILTGAGLGMSAWQMTRLALAPRRQGVDAMPDMASPEGTAWTATTALLMIAMWWVMMIAMMAPSAAPTILLYARVHRHAVAEERLEDRMAPTGAFATGYVLIWLCFSIVAAALHRILTGEGIVSTMTMGSGSRWLSGGLLVGAGLYQLSPLKDACLSHCRSPASFLSRHWRPGSLGALRLGAMHGAYCAGCCWMLMALLFVGGVMNLVWIAALTFLVLIEKLLPSGRWIGRGVGAILIVWGVATLLGTFEPVPAVTWRS